MSSIAGIFAQSHELDGATRLAKPVEDERPEVKIHLDYQDPDTPWYDPDGFGGESPFARFVPGRSNVVELLDDLAGTDVVGKGDLIHIEYRWERDEVFDRDTFHYYAKGRSF